MTTQPELRGPRGVRHAIAEFFRANLPDYARGCEAAWDTTIEVPVSEPGNPRRDAYFDRDPSAIDRWPMLTVSSGRRTQSELARDYDTPDPVMSAKYPIRVFTWVKAAGWDEALDARDDLATTVQVAALSNLTLGTDFLLIDPSTVVVDFSNIEAVRGDRFVAGSFVGFDVEATETLTERLALPNTYTGDRVDSVSTATRVLPPLGG